MRIALLAVMLLSLTHLALAADGGNAMRPTVNVGITDGDLCGSDHRVLQAAVDYIAGLGGGTVYLGPGTWTLRDSVRMRSGVAVIGSGPKTILTKAAGGLSLLAEDGDYGDVRVLPSDPSGFEVGDGVTVYSDNQRGFHSTVGTVVEKGEDGGLTLDAIMNSDFMVAQNATVSKACPLIRGVDVSDVIVRDLILDGNKENCPPEDGCRGGAFCTLRASNMLITGVTFRNMNGDGLSFQNSPDVTVEDCIFEDNAGGGCHPGSGSQRPTVLRSIMRRNGGCGMFVCWRVKHGRFEDNVLEDNGQMGISNGHKDTDNRFVRNQIRRNALSGMYFRNEAEHAAGHRCLVQDSIIEDNGHGGEHSGGPAAQIRVDGETNDIVLRGNTVSGDLGVLIGEKVGPVTLEDNEITGEIDDNRSE
ncbi:MAG TPA: right-handed parallel beta-helix repeat-containing protein [Armatimonadota bacterium]|nr:right-handed parallel beta-helix repeat-containing protein [Armatimonadota bacterium]